jgi:hypothetical protein
VDPELASVLATVITRLRAGNDGIVPVVARYDHHERTTGPLLPHLFQRALGARREVISPGTVYKLINTALACKGSGYADRVLLVVGHGWARSSHPPMPAMSDPYAV